jgi:hypothetical protein
MEPWQWAIAATLVIGLFGGGYLLFKARVDRIERQLDDHIKEDAKVHERVATLEERSASHGHEIRGLRDMRHEIIEQCTRSISDFYNDSLKRLAELREWVMGRTK